MLTEPPFPSQELVAQVAKLETEKTAIAEQRARGWAHLPLPDLLRQAMEEGLKEIKAAHSEEVESLMRFRQQVGNAQSLTQQRHHRREEGGARMVTQYLMRKERQIGAEAMGLPAGALEKREPMSCS